MRSLMGGETERELTRMEMDGVNTEMFTKSTASEWMAGHGRDLPAPLHFDTPGSSISIGVAIELPQWMKDAIEEELRRVFEEEYWREIISTTRSDIRNVIKEGLKEGLSIPEMAKKMTSMLGAVYGEKRATRIARTETGNALNAARNLSMEHLKSELGETGRFVGKSWVSVLADSTRDAHAGLDGQLADENGEWDLNGVKVPWPGHPSLPAKDRVNCLCTISMELGAGMPEGGVTEVLGDDTMKSAELGEKYRSVEQKEEAG